jgi:hypothetical protein
MSKNKSLIEIALFVPTAALAYFFTEKVFVSSTA